MAGARYITAASRPLDFCHPPRWWSQVCPRTVRGEQPTARASRYQATDPHRERLDAWLARRDRAFTTAEVIVPGLGIVPGQEDPRSTLRRLERQVGEVEEALEEMAGRLRALEKWGGRLEKEMVRAVLLLVGVE